MCLTHIYIYVYIYEISDELFHAKLKGKKKFNIPFVMGVTWRNENKKKKKEAEKKNELNLI